MFCVLLFNFVNYVFYCYVYILLLLLLRLCFLIVMYVLFCVFCFIVSFCVLFVYRCVLYCRHRVSTQLQLTNISISYRIISFFTEHVISLLTYKQYVLITSGMS